MRRFKDFIKKKSIYLGDCFSAEELEDQFLRLEEVFGCKVSFYNAAWLQKSSDPSFCIHSKITNLLVTVDSLVSQNELIIDELDQIKYRMEHMYPVYINYEVHPALHRLSRSIDPDKEVTLFNITIK